MEPVSPGDLATLDQVQRRVLWIATRMIDVANSRAKDEVKVGGHQASTASMVSIMTALWFAHLQAHDKVAVKPHASPAYHAIKYLTGELEASWLTTLRSLGGLQAYPSRTKDPDVTDFSTGSVGLGAVAPLFAAVTHRYLEDKLPREERPRFFALVGDAELDEGNVWEAIADPITAGVGNFTLVVDVNRQSLDRVIPDIQAHRLIGTFEQAGWHVVVAKYGRRLQAECERSGGHALRRRLDAMSNEAYQELFALRGDAVREALLVDAEPELAEVIVRYDDETLMSLITDLGGHDLGLLVDSLRACDAVTDRPSVLFAYTIKGWGLPIAGDSMNHSALLTPPQIDELRARSGLLPENEWSRFDPESDAGMWCAAVGARINNQAPAPRRALGVPTQTLGVPDKGLVSSQEAFGRVLARLAEVAGVGERIVTVAPDVSVTTNLGGWINKVGVYSHDARQAHGGDDRLVKWTPTPQGQHIELGISEMNLFMLLGQLGLSHDHHGEQLLPVGAVYDPFVLRGLDAFIYGLYNQARFIVVGTPSGVTLAPEGGAHQSTITASVGLELPQVCFSEPCFAAEVDWLLCDALERLTAPEPESAYLRLSTRPVDQALFGAARDRYGEERLRQLVLAGGYRLWESPADDRPGVILVTTGVMAPEVVGAAVELDAEGVAATVVHLTSPDRVYRSWQRRYRAGVATASRVRAPSHLHQLIPAVERRRPIVSVHDAASHSLAWLGSALGTSQITLGVDEFGQSGTVADLHRVMGISTGDVVNAALIAVHESAEP